MGFSSETNQIIRALHDLAEEYSLVFRTEHPVFPHCGRHSERVDVVFTLPTGRPILWFEIDNQPDRAAHNRLKVFGDVLALSSIPVVSLAIHHGRAATSPHAYPNELLTRGFVLPPRFLDVVSVDNSSYETVVVDLREWLSRLINDLATAPEWGTVLDIAEQYQPLIRNLSLRVAAAHLEVQSEFAWFLVEKGRLDKERAACLSIALSRMLQRAGYHRDALRHMRAFRNRVPNRSSLSAVTADEASATEFRLTQPAFRRERALEHLKFAVTNVQGDYYKSKFLWRQAVAHILNGSPRKAEYVIQEYLSLMGGSAVTRSNVAFLRTLESLCLRRGDPREYADEYQQYQRHLLAQTEGAPDGTVHGVVTALYLKLISERARGNDEAAELYSELDRFCARAGIPQAADGLCEIRALFPNAGQPIGRMLQTAPPETLPTLLTRARKETLERFCERVNVVCDSGRHAITRVEPATQKDLQTRSHGADESRPKTLTG